IGNAPLRLTKSVATGNSERQCQNGYRAAEGTSLVPRSKSIVAVQGRFRLEYRNSRSPNKNSLSIASGSTKNQEVYLLRNTSQISSVEKVRSPLSSLNICVVARDKNRSGTTFSLKNAVNTSFSSRFQEKMKNVTFLIMKGQLRGDNLISGQQPTNVFPSVIYRGFCSPIYPPRAPVEDKVF
ncbi:hypothetical protein AVEN_268670-1, partial [Araneus ventricosus]